METLDHRPESEGTRSAHDHQITRILRRRRPSTVVPQCAQATPELRNGKAWTKTCDLDQSRLAPSHWPRRGTDTKESAVGFQHHRWSFGRAATGSHYSLPDRSIGDGRRRRMANVLLRGVRKRSEERKPGADWKLGTTGSCRSNRRPGSQFQQRCSGRDRKVRHRRDAFYVLTFDGLAGDGPNEYHALEVKIAKPGLTVRTRSGTTPSQSRHQRIDCARIDESRCKFPARDNLRPACRITLNRGDAHISKRTQYA